MSAEARRAVVRATTLDARRSTRAREYARGARTRRARAGSREDEHAPSPTWALAHDARMGNGRRARARFCRTDGAEPARRAPSNKKEVRVVTVFSGGGKSREHA